MRNIITSPKFYIVISLIFILCMAALYFYLMNKSHVIFDNAFFVYNLSNIKFDSL